MMFSVWAHGLRARAGAPESVGRRPRTGDRCRSGGAAASAGSPRSRQRPGRDGQESVYVPFSAYSCNCVSYNCQFSDLRGAYDSRASGQDAITPDAGGRDPRFRIFVHPRRASSMRHGALHSLRETRCASTRLRKK